MKTRVKICGITSIEDAQTVCDSGVDALGLVFYEKSPRNVSIKTAKSICANTPPFVTTVGLFLDASKQFVDSVLASVPLDLLQFHGSESPEYCASFNRPYIKVVGMKSINSDDEFKAYADQFNDAKGFLVDSHATGKAGGTGQTFDWSDVPQSYDKPIILAGGLNPDNIADAISQVSVYGVDLSSGVESQAGVKDKQKVTQLMNEIHRIECSRNNRK